MRKQTKGRCPVLVCSLPWTAFVMLGTWTHPARQAQLPVCKGTSGWPSAVAGGPDGRAGGLCTSQGLGHSRGSAGGQLTPEEFSESHFLCGLGPVSTPTSHFHFGMGLYSRSRGTLCPGLFSVARQHLTGAWTEKQLKTSAPAGILLGSSGS